MICVDFNRNLGFSQNRTGSNVEMLLSEIFWNQKIFKGRKNVSERPFTYWL